MRRKRNAVVLGSGKVRTTVSKKRTRELAAAKIDLQKIMDEIRPYIRESRIVNDTTAGKWCDSKSLLSNSSY